jgi:CubicO group peptidase (beta-lactamase class C family)
MPPAKTERIRASIEDWMQSYVESHTFPGLMLGVYDENQKELFYHATSKGDVYKRDTLFRIYSMTKPITCVAFLILMERGLVSLEDNLCDFIPAFKETQVLTGGTIDEYTTEPLNSPIKMIHLLAHTSGISSAIFGNSLNDQLLRKNFGDDWKTWFHHLDNKQFCDIIAESHLSFQPGTKFHYSLATDVLGHVVEVISGLPLDEFFQKEIFDPLGMIDSFFYVPEEKLSRLAEIYEVAPGQNYKISHNSERDRSKRPYLLAGGGKVVSTIDDFAKFACCLLNHGIIDKSNSSSKRLLQEETVRLMYQNHLPNFSNMLDYAHERDFSESYGIGHGFGLGVYVIVDPSHVKGGTYASAGEYGWGGVACTSFFIDPVKKITAILLTQVIPAASFYPIRAQARWFVHSLVNALEENHSVETPTSEKKE